MTKHAKALSVAPDTPASSPGAGSKRKADTRTPLEALVEEIERLTGMRICIYDLNFFLNESPKLRVPQRLCIHDSKYCHFVKSNPEAYAKCIQTENWRTERAGSMTKPLVHTCHAGVTDLILPVRVDGHQVGAVFMGQVFAGSKKSMATVLQELRTKYHYHEAGLQAMADSVRVVPVEELRKLGPLLAAITDYLEQAEQLAALQSERESWAHGKNAYESLPHGNVQVEQLPTPLLDRLQVEIQGEENARISKAVTLIRKSYWKNLSCHEISRSLGMSQSHFSREFHRVTGMTYRQCLLECRLNAVFYLIKRNRYTIEEAAVVVGYEDGCSLQRAFKNFTGLTPHQFLRRYPRAFMLERFDKARAV